MPMFCYRHNATEGASQFWWQSGPKEQAYASHKQLNKLALFPIHVLEYNAEGTQGKSGLSLSPRAAAETQSDHATADNAILHSKGKQIFR